MGRETVSYDFRMTGFVGIKGPADATKEELDALYEKAALEFKARWNSGEYGASCIELFQIFDGESCQMWQPKQSGSRCLAEGDLKAFGT